MLRLFSVTHLNWDLLRSFPQNNLINLSYGNYDHFYFFQLFLALKIISPHAFYRGFYDFNINSLMLILVFFSLLWHKTFKYGLFVILSIQFYEVWRTWPFTINHSALELGIVLLMCLTPNQKSAKLSINEMVKILMLSVWFLSGFHKILDGYFLNGEFFSLEALGNNTTLGKHLNDLVSLFGPHIDKTLRCCQNDYYAITNMQMAILFGFSWLTILAEIFFPVLTLIPKYSFFGLIGLFLSQILISYFSGEIDFAFTAFAILFLFVPKIAKIAYPCLSLTFLLVQPWL